MKAKFVDFQRKDTLSIVQIATDDRDVVNYNSCGNLFKNNLIEVIEINEGGSVNSIAVINHSNEPVFFMDGDILQGAKQNRVLNTSVLLAPNKKTIIPVSCVEAGRWHFTSQRFKDSEYTAPTDIRASKAKTVKGSLAKKEGFKADQSKVWREVSEKLRCYQVPSLTMNLSDIYEQKANSIEKFTKDFKTSDNANGIAVFCKNKLLNVDVFGRCNIYREYFPKLIRSAALSTIYLKSKKKPLEEAEAKFKTLDFFDKLQEMEFETHPGVGMGVEYRYEANELTGFKLVYNSCLIHLTALNTEDNNHSRKTFRERRML